MFDGALRDAVRETVAAGTARAWKGHRIGGADGRLAASSAGVRGEGWVDLEARRAWLAQSSGESAWVGTRLYYRDEPESGDGWSRVPLVGLDDGLHPYSSPFWPLEALAAVRETGDVVGHDTVRHTVTTRIHITLKPPLASGVDVPAIRRQGGVLRAVGRRRR